MLRMANVKLDDTRNLLSYIQLFEGLAPAQLDWIAQHAHRRNFEAGRNVMTIEQPGEAVYIILHGTVKIHIEQGERDVILAIRGAGDLLGEMSLIDSIGRSASVVTLETSLMLWMDKTSFNYMLDNFPPVARNLVKILSARVRLSNQLIQALATLDVNGRVARQLLAFAEKYGREKDGVTQIRITLTQGDIADLVGASRKRVNQAMVSFKEQGLIDDLDGRIAIKDGEGLARYCR
ncbi:MAG TPA: Crp/Fnr family transcriptional regulator [Anaerolineales bacterium]|jgi:CRP/FNR family cyclic AMP-dependent transcriptional regulator|nr:Crp/Fnr family transcriptional regulator [Anaerolineales bacterium]HQX15602.1 Crp/Fnr family transcriptional regulator [Anaerolineales bacterium]